MEGHGEQGTTQLGHSALLSLPQLTSDYFVEILAEPCQTLKFVRQAANKDILSVKSKF